MFIRYIAVCLISGLLLLGGLRAQTLVGSLDDIDFWVGSGSNRAGFVIDWKNGVSSTSLAWGYRWDGAATGEDMFRAVAGLVGTNLSPAVPDSSGDPVLSLLIRSFSFGNTVFEVSYSFDSIQVSAGGFESGGFWSYWLGGPSESLPTTWTSSMVGFSDRVLTNNSWDGWSWAANFVDEAPSVPFAAIPEPSAILLLMIGSGALWILARRRRTTGS